jgi:electron transfer flavoprotein-quinone oxidoreductase
MNSTQPQSKIEFDVIVVGAGLAGSTAAAVAAQRGLKVALVERGQAPGAKNLFGGALYTHSLEEIYPDLWDRKPPLERPVTETGFWFLSKDGLVNMTVRGGALGRQPADARGCAQMDSGNEQAARYFHHLNTVPISSM